MKVKDVIKLSCFVSGETEIRNYLDGNQEESQEILRAVDDMLECLHIVATEIAGDRYALKAEETFTPVDKKVYFKDFAVTPYRIYGVSDQRGNKIPFGLKPKYLETDGCPITVEFAFLPQKKTIEEESDFTYTPITERTLAYGVVAEYKLMKGFTDEAIFWREKFEKDLLACLTPKNNLVLKRRVFV